jgi:hypothetical protein
MKRIELDESASSDRKSIYRLSFLFFLCCCCCLIFYIFANYKIRNIHLHVCMRFVFFESKWNVYEIPLLITFHINSKRCILTPPYIIMTHTTSFSAFVASNIHEQSQKNETWIFFSNAAVVNTRKYLSEPDSPLGRILRVVPQMFLLSSCSRDINENRGEHSTEYSTLSFFFGPQNELKKSFFLSHTITILWRLKSSLSMHCLITSLNCVMKFRD